MNAGWELKKLGDVCDIIGGGTPSKANTAFYEGNIPWATVRDMNGETLKSTEFKITHDAVRQSSTNIIPKGNVIIATRVGLGKVCLVAQNTAINQDLRGIIPKNKNKIIETYLFWWLKSISHTIEAAGTGATVKGVKLPFVKSLQIPLPPLPEQKRIVAILDEAFTSIDTAKKNTEKNLKNARELFESHLNEVFTKKGEGWVEKRLGEECEILMGQSPVGTSYNTEGVGVPLINGPVEFGGTDPFSKTVASKYTTKPTKMCQEGDLILCVRGSTTGRMNIAGQDSCIGRGVAAIRSLRNQNWVNHFINFNREKIYSLGSGSTFPNVSNSVLEKIIIPLPPIEHREKIIKKIQQLVVNTNRLESIYQRKLTALDELKKSLLHQTFSGQL
jgi:type I restriction enzyme S subunit